MTPESDVYLCPVCSKPFDLTDGLVNFAIASHEEGHAASSNGPANMIRYNDTSRMWVCKICGDPLHLGEYSARLAVIAHCRTKHGQTFGSSAPVTARGGRSGGSRSGFGKVADVVEDAVEAIGGALGKLLDP